MNKFIRIGCAIYNIKNIISIHKIERDIQRINGLLIESRNTKRNDYGLRVESKNDLTFLYYTTKKERDNIFEIVSYQLINQK